MFSRDEMQRAIEDALKSMEGVALELYRRGREPLLAELEEARRLVDQLGTARDKAEAELRELQRSTSEALAQAVEWQRERDEARTKYEVLYDEADRALRAPLLALSAIVGGDAFFAPGPWDSQTQGMNALAERITRSFAIWRDRAAKQSTEDFKRGAEAMRKRCAMWVKHNSHEDGLGMGSQRMESALAALPIPEET